MQRRPKNRDLTIALDGKLDVLSTLAEVLAVPLESAYS